ncbi:MAG TPA: NAD(P)-dependent oxidoreductase, partial [Rhizomicrobium sp.]
LANDAAIREVGLDGALLDGAAKGLIHCNMATVSLDMARALDAAHARRGLGYAAAPVFGRPNVAAQGGLLVVAAGAPETIAILRPLLDAVGRRVEIVGETPEQANLFKIAGNFMIVSVVEILGEAFALLRKGGGDHAQFQAVMASTLFASPIYQNYGKLIVDQAFDPPGFRLVLGLKDVNLARSAAAELGSHLPLGALMAAHLEEAVAAGLGESDLTAATALIAKKAGL